MSKLLYVEIKDNKVVGEIHHKISSDHTDLQTMAPLNSFCGSEYTGVDGELRTFFLSNTNMPKTIGFQEALGYWIKCDPDTKVITYRMIWSYQNFDPGIPLFKELDDVQMYTAEEIDADGKSTGEYLLTFTMADKESILEFIKSENPDLKLPVDVSKSNPLDYMILHYDKNDKLVELRYWARPDHYVFKDKNCKEGCRWISYHPLRDSLDNPEDSDLAIPMKLNGHIVGDHRVDEVPVCYKKIKLKNGSYRKVRIDEVRGSKGEEGK